jgi:hypothetical protein
MEFTWLSRWQPQLLAILRIVVALLFLEHATIKLFGFPPGGNPANLMRACSRNRRPVTIRKTASSCGCQRDNQVNCIPRLLTNPD